MKKNAMFIICGFVFVYCLLYGVLYPKSGFVKEFYKQDNDTIDVLILGSSNSYSNINPALLWDEYGISSYLLCGSGQPIWNSYYYLKEAYKTQSPKVVILDVFTVSACLDEFDELSNVPGNTLSLKCSKNKLDNIRSSVNEEDFVNLLLGLPIFHNRWTEFFENKVKPWEYDTRNGAIEKGFYPVFFFETFEQQSVNENVYSPISEKNELYLQKIIDLTKENGSELLLIKTPYVLGAESDAVFNSVEEKAKENDITFLNLNMKSNEMNFDYANDMADIVHLNNLGVEKVTKYLGNILNSEYMLPNHKGDVKYDTWGTYSNKYKQTKFMSPEIKSAELIKEYDDNLQMEKISDSLYILSLPADLKKNTYYKIAIQDSDTESNIITIDIFGEGYDSPLQKRKVSLNGNESFVIIKTDDLMPEKVSIRLLSGEDISDLKKLKLYELETK